jgi:AraC family transcriptional regulator of adaptative response/methylated-DNA-[protein]-cysteine methyltransferase
MLVAGTELGICAVCLGDSDSEVEAALLREYPAAEICRDDITLRNWVTALTKYFGDHQHNLDLPLDVQGTTFQWVVWKEIQSIPYGATSSYGRIARAIGSPNATRAVARACAANPVPLIIPCHRVVREDGKLGGYRWGTGRKQTLLSHETNR